MRWWKNKEQRNTSNDSIRGMFVECSCCLFLLRITHVLSCRRVHEPLALGCDTVDVNWMLILRLNEPNRNSKNIWPQLSNFRCGAFNHARYTTGTKISYITRAFRKITTWELTTGSSFPPPEKATSGDPNDAYRNQLGRLCKFVSKKIIKAMISLFRLRFRFHLLGHGETLLSEFYQVKNLTYMNATIFAY